jgi:L-alanine-DL-glutamate epimerase-like enolase superfamily enzyme
MRLRPHLVRLVDQDIWRCAREAIPEHRALLVELTVDGVSGWGEAPAFMVDVYASHLATVLRRLRAVEPLLARLDPTDPYGNWHRLRPVLADCPFALGALDVAGHDLAARLAGKPLYAQLSLPDPTGRASSYSIGLDEPEVMVSKLDKAAGWAYYKVKLARPSDLDLLRRLREHTDAPFWLDGNACWRPEDLLPILDRLPDFGVVALEQPFPVAAHEATLRARRRSPVPIFADESVTTPDQVTPAAARFDGINVKVLKAGGITPALDMLRTGRELGLATMLGCLPESTAGAGAAAHLAGLADHVDLDTVALLATDTGTGFTLDARGRVGLADRPGTGFRPTPDSAVWLIRRVGAGQVDLVIDGVCLGSATRTATGEVTVEVAPEVEGRGYDVVLADRLVHP